MEVTDGATSGERETEGGPSAAMAGNLYQSLSETGVPPA
jgi:hypothetical protein